MRGTTLLETFFGKTAVTALFFLVAAVVAGPVAAEGGDVARGEQLFALCSQCHGEDGSGNRDALAPAIAGLPEWYVVKQLQMFRSGSRGLHPGDTGGLRMYPMSQWLTNDDDVAAVSAYVAGMPAQRPENEMPEAGDAARGQGYYAVCTACHGANGEGNPGMQAPPLTGMSDWYLTSAIQKYKAGVRGSGPGDALGPAMIGMVATLPDDQAIRDVVAHIQSLGK
jgi:cytochrome c553